MWLKKTLSCSYPNLPFNEALRKENEKLQLELQCSQANLDVGECEVIQHLLDVTEVVAINSVSEKSSPMRISKKVEQNMLIVKRSIHMMKATLSKVRLTQLQETLPQYHPDVICCLLEVQIGMMNGIQICSAIVLNLFCICYMIISQHLLFNCMMPEQPILCIF